MRAIMTAELRRVWNTCLWSWQGWTAAWASEKTLRQWTIVNALSVGLGSGLIDHIQKMTIAAITMADMKVWAQRSYRVWMRRQSLSLPNMFSILWRFR